MLSGSAPVSLPTPEPDDSPALASPLTLGGAASGTIDRASDVDYFALHVDQQGYLQAAVTPRNGSALGSRLALYTIPSYALFKETVAPVPIGGGGLLAESDGQGPGNPNPEVAHIVQAGDYFLAVSASGAGATTGEYTLTTQFLPASDPNAPQPDPLRTLPVGDKPLALVTGDFNGDGILDLATADQGSGTVSVLLGNGDGTFQPALTVAVPDHPTSLVIGDVNGDGRPDLATLDGTAGTVSILLGIGDGNFRAVSHFAVPGRPDSLLPVDYNHDGHLDLAAPDGTAGRLTLLPGVGDGTFAVQDLVRVPVPPGTNAVAFGDFRQAGHLDLAALDSVAGTVSILPGTADGQFAARPTASFAVPDHPTSILSGDFDHDGHLDLATLDANDILHGSNGPGVEQVVPGVVSIFPGRGDGTFDARKPAQYPAYDPAVAGLFTGPATAVFGDFSRDGTPDLASLISVNGDGRAPFTNHVETQNGVSPKFRQTLANVPGVGLIDITPFLPQNLFLRTDGDVANPAQATPQFADLTGAGVDDAVVVSRAGDILFRAGVPRQPGAFGAPVVVNDPARGYPMALAVAVVADGPQAELAAIDLQSDTVSIYTRGPDGTWARTGSLPTGLAPARIEAADLDGDGRKDLVVVNSVLGTLSIYLQQADGSFLPAASVEAGTFISDVVLADVNGDNRPDVLVTDRAPGDVGVFLNEGLPSGQVGFAPELRFRGGAAVHTVAPSVISSIANSIFRSLRPSVVFPPLYFGSSHDETGTVAAGDFTGDGVPDLVAVNTGSDTFALLRGEQGADGRPTGGFFDPVTFDAGDHPTAVVTGDFNGDGHLDLAVLDEGSDEIAIFLGDGRGGFTQKIARDSQGNPIPLQAGLAPTGLSVHRRPDGVLDLVVGNEFGDLLTLQGEGDGTFMPYKLDNGRAVSLAVADLGGGQDDLILGSQAQDRVVVENQAQVVQAVVGDRQHGLLAPRVGTLTDLNGDGLPDLVVANTGANDVLVYLGTGNGQFAPTPREIRVGQHPVGVTIADVNGDGIPDLVVANRDSNDVSILLGQGQAGAWTLVHGPRLRAGTAPVATVVEDVRGRGVPDILVANSGSDNVTLLPGLGNGFFNDRPGAVQTFATGSDPQQVLVGHFINPNELDLLTVNAGSNDLTLFPDFGPGRSVSSGGDAPVAAVAGDFGHNGLTDLLVANSGDGLVSLLMGGQDGPSLAETFTSPDLLHPTALALSPAGDALYVADEDRGAVTRFDLASSAPSPEGVPAELPAQIALTTLTGVPGTSPLAPESGETLAALPTALKESPVPLVAILVTDLSTETEPAPTALAEAGEGTGTAPAAPAAGGADEGPPGREDAAADAAGEGTAGPTDAKTGLLNFLGGVDAAAGKNGPGASDLREGPAGAEQAPASPVPADRDQPHGNDPQPPDGARLGPQGARQVPRRGAARAPAQAVTGAGLVAGLVATAPTTLPRPARPESETTQEWIGRLAALVGAAVGWCPGWARPAGRVSSRDGRGGRPSRPRGPFGGPLRL